MIEESLRQGADGAKREVHHGVPRCLLKLRDRADAHPELDGEGLQRWLDYEFEALRWGVDPEVSRVELAALVEGSTENTTLVTDLIVGLRSAAWTSPNPSWRCSTGPRRCAAPWWTCSTGR